MTRTILGCCFALCIGLLTVGCGGEGNDVVETEPPTEAEMQAADEAYEEEMESGGPEGDG